MFVIRKLQFLYKERVLVSTAIVCVSTSVYSTSYDVGLPSFRSFELIGQYVLAVVITLCHPNRICLTITRRAWQSQT